MGIPTNNHHLAKTKWQSLNDTQANTIPTYKHLPTIPSIRQLPRSMSSFTLTSDANLLAVQFTDTFWMYISIVKNAYGLWISMSGGRGRMDCSLTGRN